VEEAKEERVEMRSQNFIDKKVLKVHKIEEGSDQELE
jgi:hypothetical protein